MYAFLQYRLPPLVHIKYQIPIYKYVQGAENSQAKQQMAVIMLQIWKEK